MLFEQFFKDLPDTAVWITGKRLKAFGRLLDKDRARLALTSGSEIPMASGRFFDVKPGGAGDSIVFPFKGIIHNFGTSDSPDWKRGVYFDSSIYTNHVDNIDDVTNDLAITGLLSSATPADDDPGWQATADGDKVGVEVLFDTSAPIPTPLSATIKSTHITPGWNDAGLVEYLRTGTGADDNPYSYPQKYARRIVFTVKNIATTGTQLAAQQSVRQDMYLENVRTIGYNSSGDEPKSIYAGQLFQD